MNRINKKIDYQSLLFEDESPFSGYLIIGTDEAGRGPLAGPVCAAAVVLDKDFPTQILNDSKKLTEKKRDIAEKIIKEKALSYAVCWATHKEIDEINILNASLLAMRRACEKVLSDLRKKGFSIDNVKILADGNKKVSVPFPNTEKPIPAEALVKGDAKIHEIMAASILAKTARDRLMNFADKKWPEYGFAKHKGYPTKSHTLAILACGFCPIHRKTFKIPEIK